MTASADGGAPGGRLRSGLAVLPWVVLLHGGSASLPVPPWAVLLVAVPSLWLLIAGGVTAADRLLRLFET